MKIDRIYNIYFSATLTTERVVKSISNVISKEAGVNVVNYNFAYPEKRKSFPKLKSRDLVIFGMPTYAGRLPNLIVPYLETINGSGALTVPIVTFGNRAFENSLMELRDILEDHNFHTFAAGAFSCEHSFSDILGKGRPDDEDMRDIAEFSMAVYKKIEELKVIPDMVNVYGTLSRKNSAEFEKAVKKDEDAKTVFHAGSKEQVLNNNIEIQNNTNSKGYYQPKDANNKSIDIRKAKPKTTDACTKCGLCISLCPMGSISAEDPRIVGGKCIKCCACVKRCPAKAKYFDDEGYLYHKNNLEELYSDKRADNVVFI